MKNISLLCLIFIPAIFSGCAALHAQNCTENAGYEKGMNDAKMGRLMFLGQFATLCSGKDIEIAQKGYKAGFEAGKNSNGTPTLNLGFKKGKLDLSGAYTCFVSARGQSFQEQAPSEVQARNMVLDKCRKKVPSCMETDVSCSKN